MYVLYGTVLYGAVHDRLTPERGPGAVSPWRVRIVLQYGKVVQYVLQMLNASDREYSDYLLNL